MARTATPRALNVPPAPKWTPAQLMAVRHMGPSMIGQEMYDAAQEYMKTTNGGIFGPALISNDPKYNQAAPKRPVAATVVTE
jgi:hypothetical protein